jgi:hypothetical protein
MEILEVGAEVTEWEKAARGWLYPGAGKSAKELRWGWEKLPGPATKLELSSVSAELSASVE